jgi:hypothetical protein
MENNNVLKQKWDNIGTKIAWYCKNDKDRETKYTWGWHWKLNAYMCSCCGDEFLMPLTKEEAEELARQEKEKRDLLMDE